MKRDLLKSECEYMKRTVAEKRDQYIKKMNAQMETIKNTKLIICSVGVPNSVVINNTV